MIVKSEVLPIHSEADIVSARQLVRRWAQEAGLSLVDITKLVTAASELARNTHEHGGGGQMRIELENQGARHGVRLSFEDQGPGIADVELALRDGYTTGKGMGIGLGGSRRLVNEFAIESQPGRGTRVMIARWRS
jgi:serine/threonine-protein kinase RsbT